MDREVRYCTTGDGVRIAYATTGSGYPMVRGLGWMSHLEFEGRTPLWRATNDALSAHFQFTRYDGRGTGLSDRNIEEFSLETYVADVEAVVDAAGLERFALLGISQGGAASIAYCQRHPERVSHLILYGAIVSPFFEPELVQSLTGLVRLGWDTLAVRQMFTTAFVPDGGPEEMRWFNEFQRETISPEAAARVLQANLELDVTESARSLSTPTLVIHRRRDGVVPFDQGRKLASLIPGARFLPLDGKNHLFLEGEEELSNFVAAIDEFIGTDSAAAKRPEPAAATLSSFRTVFFTDLVGHTEMMSRLGDERGRAVLREHERITREVLKAHGGTEVKTMGDGFMASFGSVTRAVECAIALQRAFAEREGEPLTIRVGLNAGEPIEEDGDLFGATVILASRIAAKADGGEILVADTVRGLCSGKGFLFADRGEFVAKGFEEPVRVYEVSWRQ